VSKHTNDERCAAPKCRRILTGKGVIVARDGRRFCRHHGDRLPRWMRRVQPEPSRATKGPDHEPLDRRLGQYAGGSSFGSVML
jgi:hypothetical protein